MLLDIVFTSKRLVFRYINKNDFDEISKILKDCEIMYAWEHNFSDQDVCAWIEKRITQYNIFGYDYFLAIDKNTNEVIGQIGLLNECVNDEYFTGIGYIVKKEFWHKGYATEGAEAMTDYAFKMLNKNKVIATIRHENKPSIKVAEKLGMKIEKEFTKVYNGKNMPHLVFSISKEEFYVF